MSAQLLKERLDKTRQQYPNNLLPILLPNILRDWSISGEYRGSAAFDLARTVARRAERNAVRLVTAGEKIQPTVLAYLNRLSDVLWLCARVIEARAGVDARLRDEQHPGPPWSRAW